jgi:hypothetical protein
LGGHAIAQLDGVAYLRAVQARENQFTLDLQHYGERLIHASLFEDELYTFDKQAGTFGELLLSGGTNFVHDLQARAIDRYLYVLNNVVYFKPLDASGLWMPEATITNAGSGKPTFSLTTDRDVLCFAYPTGPIVFYDVAAKAQASGRGYIGANSGAWYSPKHDVFVAIISNSIKVFANAVRPATLSNPVAISALTQGRVSRIKVQLLGANAEACVDEIVEWSMTGSGSLADGQSETDAEGWAYNDYLAPVTSTGSATISAAVKF